MTITLDIAVVVTVLGALVTIGGIIGGIIRALFVLWTRFNKMERMASYRQEDTHILLECVRALLEGQKEQGCGDAVKDALKALNDHLSSRASGLSTRK